MANPISRPRMACVRQRVSARSAPQWKEPRRETSARSPRQPIKSAQESARSPQIVIRLAPRPMDARIHQSTNPQSAAPGARGFLHVRLSYVRRCPKFDDPERQVTKPVSFKRPFFRPSSTSALGVESTAALFDFAANFAPSKKSGKFRLKRARHARWGSNRKTALGSRLLTADYWFRIAKL